MLGTFLFFSFILHGISFYWIYQLKKQKNEPSGLEDAMAIFLEDMKEDNETLIKALKDFQAQSGRKSEAAEANAKADVPAKKSNKPEPQPKEKAYSPPEASANIEEQYESSFEAKALSLAKQGLNHEEIAKKLGRGKGEVELLLRLDQAKKNN